MTTSMKIGIGISVGLVLCIILCGGGYGLLFNHITNSDTFKKTLEEADERAKAEDARPQPNKEHYEQITTGMSEEQVDKLLGMPSALEKKSDGSVLKTWNSQLAEDGAIRITFISGKATAKTMDEPPANATPTEASEDNKPKPSESFFDRHSGQYTVTIALPMGDLKLRFDVSGGSASNLEVESDGEWLKANSSSPIRLVDIKTVNLDEAIVMVEIHGDKYPLGLGVHGTQIKGAVADSQHMYRVSGNVK